MSLISSPYCTPRTCPRYSATRSTATSWVRNVLVAATPISGPACVYNTASDSRGMVDPTVLQMASTARAHLVRVLHGHQRVERLS